MRKSNYQRKVKIDAFSSQEVVESSNSVSFIYDIYMVGDWWIGGLMDSENI